MALQAEKITDPADFVRILHVARSVLENQWLNRTARTGAASNLWHEVELLQSIMTLLTRFAEVLSQSCSYPPNAVCARVKQMYRECAIAIASLASTMADTRLDAVWQDAYMFYTLQSAALTRAVEIAMKGVANSLDSPSSCQHEHRFESGSGLASVKVARIDNDCTESKVQIVFDTEDGTMFSIPKHQFKINTTVRMSVTRIVAPERNATMTAGDLSKTRLTSSALNCYNCTEENDPLGRAAVRVMNISSPVYVVGLNGTHQQQRQSGSPNVFVLNFTIKLSQPNEFQDVYFHRVTGRSKWKAIYAQIKGKKKQLPLAFPVRCLFWDEEESPGSWDNRGCLTLWANLTHVKCTCNHLSTFAVAMEPYDAPSRGNSYWTVWGISTEAKTEKIVKYTLLSINSVSIACCVIFLITLVAYISQTTFKDVYLIHCLLTGSALLMHAGLITAAVGANVKISCQIAGLLINFGGLMTTAWLLCESICLFKNLILGDLSGAKRWIWIVGVCAPLIATVTPAALSRFQQHGGDLLCLPSHELYAFWIMFGGIFAYLLLALVMSMVTTCNIETPAYLKADLIDKMM